MLIPRRLPALIACLLSALLISACNSSSSGGGGNGPQNGGDTLGTITALQLTLDGAQGLVVTGDNGVATAAAAVEAQSFDADDYLVNTQNTVDLEPNSLYKATVDGRLERVTWTSDDGEAIPPGTITPKVVTELSNRFVAIGFEQTVEGGDTLRLSFLAEKSTGFAYSEDPENRGPLYLNTFEEPSLGVKITTDRQGNIYLQGFISGGDWGSGPVGIYRIDVSTVGTGEHVEATLISGDDNAIYFWEIPYDGRFLAYQGYTAEGQRVSRLRRTDAAGFDNSEIDLGNRLILGADGEVYAFYMGDLFQDEPSKIYHLDLDVSGSSVTAVLEEMVPPEGAPEILVPFNGDRRVVAGRLIVPDGLDSTPYEVRPRQAYSRPVAELDGIFRNIRRFSATERFLFFFADTTESAPGGEANGVIIRWDGSTGQVDRLELPTQFELREFEVLSDSRVWVRAVERATDSTVIGEISITGDFTETARVPGTLQVLTLTPINPAQFIVVDGLAQDWVDDLLITTGDGAIEALGAVADRGFLKLLVRTAEPQETGLQLVLNDGSIEHTIVFETSQAVFQYYNSMDPTPIKVVDEDEGWLAASGPDGFELSIPLSVFADEATQLDIEAGLADVFDDKEPVIVEPTGESIGPASYVLP